jgi:hypothetical protein
MRRGSSAVVSSKDNEDDVNSAANRLTLAALRDELIFHLCSINSYCIDEKTGTIHISHKYYDQAESIIYRINVWRQPPVFIINESDLTPKLKEELYDLPLSAPETLNRLVTQVVGQILETVNPRYYHVAGVGANIRWRFEP